MSTPSRRFLDWKRKVKLEQTEPAHVRFSPRECRGLIRSFIAMDAIDLQTQYQKGSEEDENLAALMTEKISLSRPIPIFNVLLKKNESKFVPT